LEATTVVAFHYRQGVLMAGDHRATADNVIYSDRVEKILPLDGESLMAIAGSPAMAMEMARTLETSFEFYRRSQLQRMSLQAKTRALSRLLKENLPVVLQGVGTVVPIFAGVDRSQGKATPAIYFFDPLGAQFETANFAASGSGSLNVKSVLSFLESWATPSPSRMDLKQASVLALRLLATASRFDSATGGVDPPSGRFATIYSLKPGEVRAVTEAEQASWWGSASGRSKKT
jgi:proteasome beta subunit